MSASLAPQGPALAPIFHFLDLFDTTAAMVACHRWRPAILQRPVEAESEECPPLDPSEHPDAIQTQEGQAAIVDAAIACFVRLGRRPEEGVLENMLRLLNGFFEAYRLFPCPCQLCPTCGKYPESAPEDMIFALEYEKARAAYLREIALSGVIVPPYIRSRGVRLRTLLRAKEDPQRAHCLLRLVLAEMYPYADGDLREESTAVQGYVDRLAGPAGIAVVMRWHLVKAKREEEATLVRGPEPSAERIERAALQISHLLAASPHSCVVENDRVIAVSRVTRQPQRDVENPLTVNDFRWAFRRLADAGLGVLTEDPGLPNWCETELYFRSRPELWKRWGQGRIFDPPATLATEPRSKRGGGRPANSDPVWFATAVSLRASFTTTSGTDWKGLAREVRKQLGDGGIKLNSRDEKALTPGSLKSLFRNRDRRKTKPN